MRLLPGLAVLLVHWPELTGWLSSDPMPWAAHLGLGLPDTLLPGLPGWNDPNTGTTQQALGGLAARDWLRGVVPWWNPYSGVGLPLAAEMQSAALFLPFGLLLAFGHGLLLLKIAMQLVACAGMMALLRQLGLAAWIASLGALCFGLNGTFAWMGDGPILPVAFLPLMLLGIERAAAGRGWRWLAVGLAYAILAGFPETAYLEGLFAGGWALVRLGGVPAGDRLAFAARIAAGGIVGLMLAMPALLPFLASLPHSSLGYHAAPAGPLPGRELALFLTPYVYGPISFAGHWVETGLMGGFLQLGLLPLALLGLLRAGGPPRGLGRGLRVMMAGWCTVTFALTQGVPGIRQVLGLIPFVSEMWVSRYVWPTWEFACVCLACCGVQAWWNGRVGHRLVTLAVVASAVCVFVGLEAGRSHTALLLATAPQYPRYLAGSLLAALLVLGAAALLLRQPPGRRAGLLLGVALGLEAGGLSGFTLLSGARLASFDWPAVRFLQDHLGLARFYTLGPMSPNYGALFGTASVNESYLPVPRAWLDYVHRHLYPRAGGVLVPEVPAGANDQAISFRTNMESFQQAGVKYVLTYRDAVPFAGMVKSPRRVFAGTAVDIYELPAPAPYYAVSPDACSLHGLGRTKLDAVCAAPARLLRREMAADGWRATVNGQVTPIETSGEIFQSVLLPAGATRVRFAYAPPHIGWAYAAFLMGLMALAASKAARRRRHWSDLAWPQSGGPTKVGDQP